MFKKQVEGDVIDGRVQGLEGQLCRECPLEGGKLTNPRVLET